MIAILCIRSVNKSVKAAPTYRSRGQQLLATAVHIQEQQTVRDAIQRTEKWVNQVNTEHADRAARTRKPPERYKNDFVYCQQRGNLVKKKTSEIIANVTKAPELMLQGSSVQTICSVSHSLGTEVTDSRSASSASVLHLGQTDSSSAADKTAGDCNDSSCSASDHIVSVTVNADKAAGNIDESAKSYALDQTPGLDRPTTAECALGDSSDSVSSASDHTLSVNVNVFPAAGIAAGNIDESAKSYALDQTPSLDRPTTAEFALGNSSDLASSALDHTMSVTVNVLPAAGTATGNIDESAKSYALDQTPSLYRPTTAECALGDSSDLASSALDHTMSGTVNVLPVAGKSEGKIDESAKSYALGQTPGLDRPTAAECASGDSSDSVSSPLDHRPTMSVTVAGNIDESAKPYALDQTPGLDRPTAAECASGDSSDSASSPLDHTVSITVNVLPAAEKTAGNYGAPSHFESDCAPCANASTAVELSEIIWPIWEPVQVGDENICLVKTAVGDGAAFNGITEIESFVVSLEPLKSPFIDTTMPNADAMTNNYGLNSCTLTDFTQGFAATRNLVSSSLCSLSSGRGTNEVSVVVGDNVQPPDMSLQNSDTGEEDENDSDSLLDPEYVPDSDRCSSDSDFDASMLLRRGVSKAIEMNRPALNQDDDISEVFPVTQPLTTLKAHQQSESTETGSRSHVRIQQAANVRQQAASDGECGMLEAQRLPRGLKNLSSLRTVVPQQTTKVKTGRVSDRPARPCPFCGKQKVRLTRHIRAKHRDDENVALALKGNSKEQRAAFTQYKRTGILKYNLAHMGSTDFVLKRERVSTKDNGVVCEKCSGIFSRRWFYSHKKVCIGEGVVEPSKLPVPVVFSSADFSEDFKTEILSKFSSDKVGQLCQSDPMITMVGSKLYFKVKARKDKKLEVKRSVMTDMRRLGTLFTHFRTGYVEHHGDAVSEKEVTVAQMFQRQNYDCLEEACVRQTSNPGEAADKSGLMISLYYLVMKSARIIRVFYLVRQESAKATETAEFMDVWKLSKHQILGGAVYNNNRNRAVKLRRPQHLPRNDDLQKLRNYTVSRMTALLGDTYRQWSSSDFVELRDLACSRITLFNARRGGEPARLKLSDWTDACNKVWFDSARVEAMPDEEREVFETSMIMYQTGKGVNHLVPVIVPDDTVASVHKISDPVLRKDCTVSESNCYLFPSTGNSDGNVSGWHAINSVCDKAGIPRSSVTATKVRHLTSTMYASLDIPESRRSAFYKHMGHSKQVNENIYQAPLAETEIREVGSVLQQFGM